jgi:glutamyl-tRNA reductase
MIPSLHTPESPIDPPRYMSRPENVDAGVQRLDNVCLYNIDDLKELVCANARNRQQELALCNRIIEAGAKALLEKLNSLK